MIKVKLSKQDLPYMARLVKHLSKIRNKSIRKGDNEQLHNRINTLIREIMVMALKNENRKNTSGSKI